MTLLDEGKIYFPRLLPLPRHQYEVLDDYPYEWEHEGVKYKLVVLTGFECNIASVPRFLWFYINPFDLGPAAIFHDWIYRHGGQLPEGSWFRLENDHPVDVRREIPWNREGTDRLFARIMRESGVTKIKRRQAYLAVRIFGGCAWKNLGTFYCVLSWVATLAPILIVLALIILLIVYI